MTSRDKADAISSIITPLAICVGLGVIDWLEGDFKLFALCASVAALCVAGIIVILAQKKTAN